MTQVVIAGSSTLQVQQHWFNNIAGSTTLQVQPQCPKIAGSITLVPGSCLIAMRTPWGTRDRKDVGNWACGDFSRSLASCLGIPPGTDVSYKSSASLNEPMMLLMMRELPSRLLAAVSQ